MKQNKKIIFINPDILHTLFLIYQFFVKFDKLFYILLNIYHDCKGDPKNQYVLRYDFKHVKDFNIFL